MELIWIVALAGIVCYFAFAVYKAGRMSYRKEALKMSKAKDVMERAHTALETIMAEHDLAGVVVGKDIPFEYVGNTIRYSVNISSDVLNAAAAARALKTYKDMDGAITVESLDDEGNFKVNVLHGVRFVDENGKLDAMLTAPV